MKVLHERSTGPNFDHNEALQANTGWQIDEERWAERVVASQNLTRQSEAIVNSLERMGERVRLDSEIFAIGAISERVEELPVYRALRIIPTIAARDRRPILNGLKYLMGYNRSSQYYRYAVFSAGDLVVEGGALREVIQALSRRISRWADFANSEYGIEILFRGIEFTRRSAENRDRDGEERNRHRNPKFIGPPDRPLSRRHGESAMLYHVHANVLYWPHRKLVNGEWEKFLSSTRKRVKATWKDNGKVTKPEEIIKYCMKPMDTEQAPDTEILWLYQQTHKLKICQPMGMFKSFMADLKSNRQKVVRVRMGAGPKLCKVKKSRRLDHSKKEEDAEAHRETSGEVCQETKVATTRERIDPDAPISKIRPKNQILGVSLPQWRHMNWAEPMILVQRYDVSADSEGDNDRLQEIESIKFDSRLDWDASGAPRPAEALWIADQALSRHVAACSGVDAYKVHTCRPTVQERCSAEVLVRPADDPEAKSVCQDYWKQEANIAIEHIGLVDKQNVPDSSSFLDGLSYLGGKSRDTNAVILDQIFELISRM